MSTSTWASSAPDASASCTRSTWPTRIPDASLVAVADVSLEAAQQCVAARPGIPTLP